MNQPKKDQLAEFADLKVINHADYNYEPHYFSPQMYNDTRVYDIHVCSYADWDPLNPAHGDLVLRALVNNITDQVGWSETQAWATVLGKLEIMAIRLPALQPFDFWPTVCTAALEIMKQEAKK